MYTGFFGLNSQPFSIAPNPDFMYLGARHTEALAHLRYGLGDAGGFGIKFLHASEADIVYSIERAIEVYKNKKQMKAMIQTAMQMDHSWESVIAAYKKVYQSIA